MNKLYRLIIFDWEGTLGDTLGQLLNTVAVEANNLGFGTVDEDLARQSIDLGLVKALKRLFPHLTDVQQATLLNAVQQALALRTADVYLIPLAKEFIAALKQAGIEVAIATNKGQQALQRTLHLVELEAVFKVTRCAGQVPPKPCPQMLQEILIEFDRAPEEVLMIGDSVADVEMANYLNIDCVGFDYYHQQQAALLAAGAMHVVDNYQQLADYLNLPLITGRS